MKKKSILIIIFVIIAIFIIGVITNYIDSARVKTNQEPKFCIKTINHQGNKVTYWGLGYKVIRYVGVSPNEPYKSNIGVKKGNWFMKYELSENNKEIKTLDDFYNTSLTKDKDIRNLSELYSSFDAQKDNCFVVGAMVHNDYLYSEFMSKFRNKESAFIRVGENTTEGDLVLNDILYNSETKQLLLVTDNTRDKFSSESERTIKLREFENISEYEYKDRLYWIIYNGELNEETFTSENVFVLTVIN